MTPGNVERKLYRTQNISIRYRQNIPTPETDSYRTEMQDQFIDLSANDIQQTIYSASQHRTLVIEWLNHS